MNGNPTVRGTQGRSLTGALAVVLVSYFMIVLDNSIIFTGLPSIQAAMHLSASSLAWVQDAYTLVFGGLLLLGGRLGDLFDRRTVFVVGLGLFGTASLLVGLAQDPAWLVGARAFQGIGAAIVAPASLSILTDLFPAGPERTRATAAYGTTAGLGASLGLFVGGAVASFVSWRAGFFLNVPIAVVMVVAARRVLPAFDGRRGSLDVPGAITSTLGMGLLVFGIIAAGEGGSPNWLAVVAGLALMAVFVWRERRAAQPLMPLRVLADRGRAGAAITRLLFAGTMIGLFFFTTQWFQAIHHFTPLQAGLGFLPMTLVQLAFSLRVSRLTARFGGTALLLAGLVLAAAGMGWLALLPDGAGYLAAVAPLVLLGLGQGVAFGPLTAAGVAGVHADDAGAASGVVNTAHQLGSTIGVAVLTAVGAGSSTLAGQVSRAWATGAVMLLLALAATATLVLPGSRPGGE